MQPIDFLKKAVAEARAAKHIFPEHAACEAALESAWGASELAVRANNLFGQKQTYPAHGPSLALETREFLHGKWVTTAADWIAFPGWQECFGQRMALLHRLAPIYPHYRQALAAPSGEAFIAQVSKTWSTDPQRAQKVLALYREHFTVSGKLFA